MHMRTLSKVFLALIALGLAGCGGGDVAHQLETNQQYREQVMGAIAAKPDLAMAMQQKLLANDSLVTKVVDMVLQDSDASQYVLFRIATNQDAVDIVLRSAVADSMMRRHVMAVMKGVEMAVTTKR
ncbi:MAG: hypothetical protein ABIU54_02585 [Candidatus Eisenbacteria bacterium]